MKTKGNWVIKWSSGTYWCGSNQFDEQLRKAQIYHWKEYAEEQAAYIKRKYRLEETWEVIAVVEPKELKDTEAEWLNAPEDPVFICSVCGYSALNDYKGNSVASKFCPHCGKYMTNHDMPEED